MSLGTSIVAAIIGYFVLLIIGINLIGIIVDGFVHPDLKYQQIPENISEPKSIGLTITFCLVLMAYLFALYNFWNVGIALSALMLMISRIPKLVFESKTGQKHNMIITPKKPVDIFCSLIGWLALPLLWYSLFFLQTRIRI